MKTKFTEISQGDLTVFSRGGAIDPSVLANICANAESVKGKGRGSLRLLSFNGIRLACRKYRHGGLLRGIGGDRFLSGERAIREMETTWYLKDKSFAVVEPFCVITRKKGLIKNLYFLTVYEEEKEGLLGVFSRAQPRERLRIIRGLAVSILTLEKLGVYHPDLHLDNILVGADRSMVFLDFDRAQRKKLTKADVMKMFWRLDRYVEKMVRRGYTPVSAREKAFFLRCYRRLSGYDPVPAMTREIKGRSIRYRLGWFLDNLLYRGKK